MTMTKKGELKVVDGKLERKSKYEMMGKVNSIAMIYTMYI